MTPAVPTAVTAPPRAAGRRWDLEDVVVTLVNRVRAQHGLSRLRTDGHLRSAARAHSEDKARRGFFAHVSPDGHSPADRMRRHGCTRPGGENIAVGQRRATAVMEAWLNSPGHRANLLNPDFATIGVGVHIGSRGHWWTQNFGY
ncbi:CAP domain-containing protein [Streptomyces sp. NPDC006654]|uniref:CAP domain-containing protein n=1 Tax=Streptomyces sp. NPDC006654 TaxID=3156897 RepID=UPI003406D4AB